MRYLTVQPRPGAVFLFPEFESTVFIFKNRLVEDFYENC